MRIPRHHAILIAAPILLGSLAAGALADAEPSRDQVESLREGNRLYREGRLEEALEVYLTGYSPDAPHPVLAYNLGTTSHHLGQVPEAILWYRRAEALNPGDPWMLENLASARAGLGLQPYAAPGLAGTLSRQATPLRYAGALLAWVGLLLWVARPRRSAKSALAIVGLGLAVFVGTSWVARAAPQPAVVLEDCSVPEGDLPAGSEIWVTGETGESYQVVAGSARLECPRATVALVIEAG